MKTEIHPEYVESHVRCTCGNEFTTRSTKAELHVEICSNCHPFYTGKQKLIDTGGRVERFRRRARTQKRLTAPAAAKLGRARHCSSRTVPARPIAIAAALAVLAVVPAAAQAAPLTTLKVRSCQTGDSAHARSASFFAQMHAVPGTDRMWMRFTAYQRTATDRTLQPVPSPLLQQWRRSRPGVRTYGYDQTVTALQPGGIYAMGVEYRWLDPSGAVVRTGRRISGTCRQDGPLPNLTVGGVSARAGVSPGTESYAVSVSNLGTALARGVDVDVFVDSAQADTAHVDEIDPGQTVTVRVNGPACAQRIRAVVNRLGTVNETTDDDNVVRESCPATGQ